MKRTVFWAGAGIFASLVFSAAGGNASPFGVCSHVTRDEDADQVFARCVEAGIRNVRADFDWWRFQNKPEEWKSSRFAEILAKARAAGVTVLPIATGGCNFSSPTSGTPESFRRFGAFVGRLVGDFKDDFPVVEIWNEQNIGGFWPPQPNTAHYVGALREAYKAAKAAHPSVRVAFGGTAGPDVGFYQQAYANGAKDCFDIVNIHPYCMPNAPEGWLERQLGLMRETMARNGDAAKPIWITEMGWATREIEWPKSEYGMVRGAFKALGLTGRKNLRVLAIEQSHPGPTDRWFSEVWRQELPKGAELVNCTYGDVAERLAEKTCDAVVMPFDESCPLHATDALVNHVRRGGALVDFGGVPGYFSFRREKDGTIVNGPNGNEAFRKALRIEARHQGCESSVAANGFDTGTDGVKNYPGWRSFGTKYLRPGDVMKPMMVGSGNVAVAALYEFNSDFKGKIFTAGRALVFVGCATSERTQAAMTVRSALTAVRLGVEKYFVYEFQAPETSRTDPESHFGLLHKDYAPKPAFQAYKTLIGLWPEGSMVLTDKPWRSDGLYRVAWRQPKGPRVMALWTDGASRTIPAATVAGAKVIDLYGRAVNVTDEGLSVGTDPVFVIAVGFKNDPNSHVCHLADDYRHCIR